MFGRKHGRRLTYVLPLPYAWLIVLLCIGDILLIYLALWLQYNPSGTVGVDGMQYRYFLPLSALFVIVASEVYSVCSAFATKKIKHVCAGYGKSTEALDMGNAMAMLVQSLGSVVGYDRFKCKYEILQ